MSLGLKRLVTKLIAGWIVLPALSRRGTCIVMCVGLGVVRAEWSVWGAIVLISVAGRGGWAKRAGLGRRSHLELKRRLHLKLIGVGLLFVERRRQGDDEW